MRIAVLLDEQFPDGMASANRALLYSKGLTELGNDTVIFVPRATEHQGKIRNHSAKGIYEGVRYRYAYEPVIRKSFLGRRFQNSISLLNSFFSVSNRTSSLLQPITSVIFSSVRYVQSW
jgi:hypothetical protein